MIEIKEVTNKKDLKKFVQFPVDLYKNNNYFVPYLSSDEIKNFSPGKSPYLYKNETLVKLFLAYDGKKIVGRAAGLIQTEANKKYNQKRARLSRVDFIDDYEVSAGVIGAVEAWAKSEGMTSIHGPLGFNDLDREGLLIEGFEELSTFETYYNFAYYQMHFEKLGYKKDIDWLEYEVKIPPQIDERNSRLAKAVMKRSKLKEVSGLSRSKLLDTYAGQILDLNDEVYAQLYATVPLSQKVREDLIKQFKLMIDTDYLSVVVDEEDKVAGFGLGFPSIAKAVQKSRGRLFPLGVFRIMREMKKTDRIDFCLIGVAPKYQNSGLPAIIFNNMAERIIKNGIKYAETNPQMETNFKVQGLFDQFDRRQHRRRRCFVKNL